MSINMDKLIKLNDLVTTSFRRKHIIVLNPEEKIENKEKLNANILYDKAEWKINEKIYSLVDDLSQNNQLSNEDKILLIYEKLCQDYVYDDNVLSYIQKSDDDSYDLPDRYGREIDEEWEKNREQHNRRVCYEVSRYLAKALIELFKDNEGFNICILYKFNESRSKEAIGKIENEISNNTDISNQNLENQNSNPIEESDDIAFLRNAIEILKNKYNIDSQGLYEYMKEIVDIKLGPEARKKVWKEIKGNTHEETRYIRCLVLDVDNQKYIIDVDKMSLRTFDEEELRKEDRDFIPYKELLSEDVANYRRHQLYNGLYNGR